MIKLPTFTPSQGLRQGDPLSPYLFILCIEVLGQCFHRAVGNGSWKGIRVSQRSPPISHVFFADDFLLVGEAPTDQARIIEDVSPDFCAQSRQKLNLTKSKVWFTPNVPHRSARG